MSDLVVPAIDLASDILQQVLLTGLGNGHTRRAYARALKKFTSWLEGVRRPGLSRELLEDYRAWLEKSGNAASSINQDLSALRRLLRKAGAAGYVDPRQAEDAAKVANSRALGTRAGNWLTAEKARKLLDAPDETTLKGQRDRAMLAVLVGCGLRREELVNLDVEDLELREDRWVIPHLLGKGRRVRLVPIPGWVKERLDIWTTNAKIREKRIFRALLKSGAVAHESLSTTAVWKIVVQYAEQIGIDHLTPHDLRRTCAKLCRANRGDLEQIRYLLGHGSLLTTERYLGGEQKVKQAVNDRLFRKMK